MGFCSNIFDILSLDHDTDERLRTGRADQDTAGPFHLLFHFVDRCLHFRKNGGEVDTLVGVTGNAGYAMVGGKKKAVRLIARAINSGTSFMVKQPVFRRAASASTGAAKAAIVSKAEKMCEDIINS